MNIRGIKNNNTHHAEAVEEAETHSHILSIPTTGREFTISTGTVLKRERVLHQVPLSGHNRKAKQWGAQSFGGRGVLAYFHSYSLRCRLLIKHTSEVSRDGRGRHYL